MKGYLFITNTKKPINETDIQQETRLTNMSIPCLQSAYDMGYNVFMGVGKNPDMVISPVPAKFFLTSVYRNPFALKDNFRAYKDLVKVIKENNIEVIHCNTPVGGMLGRLAGKKCGVKKVIYTAHGFHFYKGAPLFNRTILKWAELLMAHFTDAIITMNEEDYKAAQKMKLRNNGKVFFVHGVGIDTEIYGSVNVDAGAKRQELGLKEDDIVLISMGDLIKRKNYTVAIEAIAKANNKKLKYLICGRGPELDNLKALAESLGVSEQIHFLGFRRDVKELLKVADVFLFSTLQEGMPRSMMEAMASGLPCVASKIRGNTDLIEEGVGGYVCEPTNSDEFALAIQKIAESSELRKKMGQANLEKVKNYDISVVEKEMAEIYKEVLSEQ